MMKMKAAAFVLTAAMAVSLAGCGGQEAAPASKSASAEAVSEAATEAASKTAEETPEAAKEEKAEKTEEVLSSASEDVKEASSGSEEKKDEKTSESVSDTSDAETAEEEGDSTEDSEASTVGSEKHTEAAADAPEIDGLTFDHAMDLEYADCFNVYYYNDGYKLIDIPQSGQYLVIPEGAEAPEGTDPEIYLLYQPLDQVYMAATGSMSFIDQIGAMDNVTMSSLDKDGWMIDAPKKAMEEGKMVYAGKYSEPDYELMIGQGCDIAIESTMILHSPEVQEMIEDLGIPVLIDRSSYELDAFGRIEWLKMYGALFNKEEQAEEKFKEQEAVLDGLEDFKNTGKTVAFFAVNTNNTITVRKTEDFIPNMIELAGGKYIFDDLENPGSTSASVRMSMEEFYNAAVDADYLIYNGTIEDPIKSIDELIGKDELFAEFKAVKEGNVWTVDKTWYQSTATIAYLIKDFNIMLTDGDPAKMTFLKKVE